MNIAYEDTTVTVEKSQADVRKLFRSFGIQDMQFQELGSQGTAAVRFKYDGREVSFQLSPRALLDDLKRAHPKTHVDVLAEKSERIMWRQLYNYLKAALWAIRYRVRSLDEIFLSAICLPNGQTIGVQMEPILTQLTAGHLCLPEARR